MRENSSWKWLSEMKNTLIIYQMSPLKRFWLIEILWDKLFTLHRWEWVIYEGSLQREFCVSLAISHEKYYSTLSNLRNFSVSNVILENIRKFHKESHSLRRLSKNKLIWKEFENSIPKKKSEFLSETIKALFYLKRYLENYKRFYTVINKNG